MYIIKIIFSKKKDYYCHLSTPRYVPFVHSKVRMEHEGLVGYETNTIN